MERALLEGFLEKGLSLEQIGALVGRNPSTVSYWLRKHGLEPVHKRRHAARGGIERATLESLVEAGASSREMATQLGVSLGTVRHWLSRYRLQTQRSADRERPKAAGKDRPEFAEMDCRRHGSTLFRLEGRGRYRCLRCRSGYVSDRRRRVKSILVNEAGGCCRLCGYDRFAGALQFHHLDPREKSFGVSDDGLTRSLERARVEASKCVLLCSNCHAEVEAGVASL
jgi:transposase